MFFLIAINNCDAQSTKPNVIFILADDVGYKSLKCNGGNLYSTPNIDKLAKNGMRFTQCHTAPTCSPSRFLLLTGKYNFRNYTISGSMDINQRTIGNMFRDAGYKTACFGKWQLDGGDASIRALGFDTYTVHNPFDEKTSGNRYKSPLLYSKGKFIDDSLTAGKYSEDIFIDSIFSFIGRNKNKPFFIYYPMNLVHMPFQPTPDDEEYETWDAAKKKYDTAFFPSMMSYMDKKIGELVSKLKTLGIDKNTVVLFSGDNGTPGKVWEYVDEDGNEVAGGKLETTEAGTHVPLIVKWPGVVAAGSVKNDLIGFVDILPTLAEIAGIPVPDYGPLDGVSFAPRLTNNPGTPRKSLFYHYDSHPESKGVNEAKRWAQTTAYKLYDTSYEDSSRLFYNIVKDPEELNPIHDSLLTPEETIIKQQLQDVINKYIGKSAPIVGKPSLISVNNTSAKILNSILMSGGSTITSSGVVWSTGHNPVLSGGNHTSENGGEGEFYSFITGLKSNTTYYIRTYATNVAGTVYSEEINFTTLRAPISTNATEVRNRSFVANWNVFSGAEKYKIDVSNSPSFTRAIPMPPVIEAFDNGTGKPPKGWIYNNRLLETDTVRFGQASPSMRFEKTFASITTATYQGPATTLSFWIKNLQDNAGSLLVEGFDGLVWTVIDNITNISKTGEIKLYDSAALSYFENGFTRFRFTYTKLNGDLFFDDLVINYNKIKHSSLPGYNDRSVVGNFLEITGLKKNTPYYYRVRAKDDKGISGNSNTITVLTRNVQLDTPLCTNATAISNTGFTANWNELPKADLYKLDVSKLPTFAIIKPKSAVEGFNNGLTPPAGWTFSANLNLDTANFGEASPSIKFFKSGQSITTAVYPAPVSKLSFFVKRFQQKPGALLVEGFDGITWKTIENITTFSKSPETRIYDSASTPTLEKNFIQFRFTFTKDSGFVGLDDIQANYNLITPSFVPGYNDLTVTGNSLSIAGLGNKTKYYYRIRGISNQLDDTSANSNVIEVCTCSQPVISAINVTEHDHFNNASGSIDLDATGDSLTYAWVGPDGFTSASQNIKSLSAGTYHVTIASGDICATDTSVTISERIPGPDENLLVNIFPNPSSNEFTLVAQTNKMEQTGIVVSDLHGKIVYRHTKIDTGKYVFGKNLQPGTYFAHIIQGKNKKTIKLVKLR